MTFEEFNKTLKDGFNIERLAEAFNCSTSYIKDLKSRPVEGKIYHKADINTSALYEFAVKSNINLDSIDFTSIVKKLVNEAKISRKLEVGTITPFGEIISVNKIGKSFSYLIKTSDWFVVKGSREILEAFDKEALENQNQN